MKLKLKKYQYKYSIIEDKIENGLPTYYVLKLFYFFGISIYGQLFGIDGCPNTPFQDRESAEQYKQILKENGRLKKLLGK